MSKIDELIVKLCPEGVPLKSLTEVSNVIRGLNYSKSDEDPGGEIRVLRANNIEASSQRINLRDVKTLRSSLSVDEKYRLRSGDILISTASGSRAHVGKVAFIESNMNEYFGGFMAAIRSNENINPRFLFHILTASDFRDYLDSNLSTSTINNLNATLMAGFYLPLPPLDVQKEIVSILDKFTQLEAELEAELEARRTQYEVTRDRLLDFSTDLERHPLMSQIRLLCPLGVPRVKLEQIGSFERGQRFVKDDMVGVGVPCIHYGEVYTKYGNRASRSLSFLAPELASKLRKAKRGDVLLAAAGETVADIGKAVVWLGDDEIVFHDALYRFRTSANPHFMAYFFESVDFKSQARMLISSSKISAISIQNIGKVEVSLPPIEVQVEIVSVLDAMSSLVNDITIGIPAETLSRRKQYEYFRNKLLTFKELDAA